MNGERKGRMKQREIQARHKQRTKTDDEMRHHSHIALLALFSLLRLVVVLTFLVCWRCSLCVSVDCLDHVFASRTG